MGLFLTPTCPRRQNSLFPFLQFDISFFSPKLAPPVLLFPPTPPLLLCRTRSTPLLPDLAMWRRTPPISPQPPVFLFPYKGPCPLFSSVPRPPSDDVFFHSTTEAFRKPPAFCRGFFTPFVVWRLLSTPESFSSFFPFRQIIYGFLHKTPWILAHSFLFGRSHCPPATVSRLFSLGFILVFRIISPFEIGADSCFTWTLRFLSFFRVSLHPWPKFLFPSMLSPCYIPPSPHAYQPDNAPPPPAGSSFILQPLLTPFTHRLLPGVDQGKVFFI